MPSAPYAKALVRIAGGATQSGGITVAASQSVALQGENTTGWRVAQWQIIGPPGWAAPAGWTDVDGVATYTGTTENPPSWTLPTTSDWGKWAVTLTVNGGEKDGDAAHPEMVDTTLMLSLASANGLVDLAVGEAAQFDELRGWSAPIQTALRAVDDALGLLSGTAELVTLVGTGSGGGDFLVGDIVCSANDAVDKSKVKLATAVNLASADAASVRIILEQGSAGDSVQAAGIGDRVHSSVIGLSSSTTKDVATIDSSGLAARTARAALVATQWVIGELDLEGNITILPSGPGSRGIKNIAAFGAVGDGVTDDAPATQAFIDALSYADAGFIPNPNDYYYCRKPIRVRDSTAGKRSIVVVGECDGMAASSFVTANTFRFELFEPHGTSGAITAFGNGSGAVTFTADARADTIAFTPGPRAYAIVRFTTTGVLPAGLTAGVDRYLIEVSPGVCKVATSLANAVAGTAINITDAGTGTHTATVQATGTSMMTMTLGAYTGTYTPNADGTYVATGSYAGGSACRRVLASEAEQWIGEWVSIPHAVGMDVGVAGEWAIAAVPADDTIVLAGGISSSNSGLAWRINLPCFDVRCRDIKIGGLIIVAPNSSASSARVGCALNINSSPLAGALSVANVRVNHVAVISTLGSFRHGISIARKVVPSPGHTSFGVNGNGYRQLWDVTQVDTIHMRDVLIYLPPNSIYTEAGIEHVSSNGQSRDSSFVGGNFYCRAPYLNPSRGAVGSSGQMDFEATSFSTPETIFTLGGGNSRPRTVKNCYAEGCGRIVLDRGSGSSAIRIEGGAFGFTSASVHPCGAMMQAASLGPIMFHSQVHGVDNKAIALFESAHNLTAKEQVLNFVARMQAQGTRAGVRARLDSTTTVGGLLRFAGTETFGITVNATSGAKTFTATAATDEIAFTAGPQHLTQVRFTTTGTLPAGLALATDYWLVETRALTFTANAGTDEISFTAGPRNLARVTLSTSGTLPAGLVAGTYWLIETSAGVCKLARTYLAATEGRAIDITDTGTGTHTLTVQSSPGVARVATSIANALAGTCVDITDAGSGTHTVTVQESLFTCSQANFNAACGVTVDLNWIQPWQFMQLVKAQVPAVDAYADADGYRSHIESLAEGTVASIQITTNTTPMVWPAFSIAGLAQQQTSKDTNGLVLVNRSAGSSIDPSAIDLTWDPTYTILASDTPIPCDKFRKRYGNAGLGGNRLESTVGIAGTATSVPAKNLWSTVTHSAGTTTFAWNASNGSPAFNPEENATYPDVFAVPVGQSGGPAAGALQIVSQTKTTTGVTFTVAADPGGAATVTWRLLFMR